MKRSRKGVWYAVAGFILISLVALAGMTWATVATWRLAEWNINQERLTRVRDAVERMDNYVLGILKVEAGRQYWEYVPWHRPEMVLTDPDIDPRGILLPSPLLSNRPQHEWIELYFQATEKGNWSSPHTNNDDLARVTDTDGWSQAARNRALQMLSWLKGRITIRELKSRLDEAVSRDTAFSGDADDATSVMHLPLVSTSSLVTMAVRDDRTDQRAIPARGRNPRSMQQVFLPQIRCVPTDIAAENLGRTPADDDEVMPIESMQSTEIEIRLTPLVPIWLNPDETGDLKIAFVRTVDKAFEKVYQGFVGDWDRLKHELLRRAKDLVADAELKPILEPADRQADADPFARAGEMEQLPIRLTAGVGVSAGSEAWRSIRGVLLVSWAGVLAVLAAAGWGIRNLVSLTDRRLQFAYAVTHELRTPLTTFRLYTDMLSAGLVPEEKRQEYLDTLNRESQRLSTLVEDVLEYARLENQKLRLNPIKVNGDDLLRRLNEHLEQRCRANGIQAAAKNDVPPTQPLRTDVDLVSQIANVLVNNAVRHARASADPTVLVQLSAENGTLHVDVVDSGPGVERADTKTIFKPFRRGRNADALGQGGIGLGLSLARNWAALLGGRLDLVARKHPRYGGAHFRLSIPSQLQE